MDNLMKKTAFADIRNLKITVAYDNVPHEKNLRTDWGFSCLVQGLGKTILFDTGRFDTLFMDNLAKLGIDPADVDELVISHDHPDHMGGALTFLDANPRINVSLVNSFGPTFKKAVCRKGSRLVEIDQPAMITPWALSTGEMKSMVRNEHALVILTSQGAVVITGCAHPGVVDMVERVLHITRKKVVLVAGGFHLFREIDSTIKKAAKGLKELGVEFVAPSHCSRPGNPGNLCQSLWPQVH